MVQTPYGDSGKTTFFIKAEEDWDENAEDIIGQELKVMKRIDNKAAAVEACITRHGTIVGPFMTDLTGYPELTPYKGGWCGNDLFPEALTSEQRATAINHVRKLGDRLARRDTWASSRSTCSIDLDTDEVYLGELNPRISGASSMTNVTAGAYADVPLFLFHLLEFMDVDYTVDVEEINDRWRELAAVDVWAQLIMKEPSDSVERIRRHRGPAPGISSEDGDLTFARVSNDWHEITHEDEAFFLRVYAPATSGSRAPISGSWSPRAGCRPRRGSRKRCRRYIDGIRGNYQSEPLPDPPGRDPTRLRQVGRRSSATTAGSAADASPTLPDS